MVIWQLSQTIRSLGSLISHEITSGSSNMRLQHTCSISIPHTHTLDPGCKPSISFWVSTAQPTRRCSLNPPGERCGAGADGSWGLPTGWADLRGLATRWTADPLGTGDPGSAAGSGRHHMCQHVCLLHIMWIYISVYTHMHSFFFSVILLLSFISVYIYIYIDLLISCIYIYIYSYTYWYITFTYS